MTRSHLQILLICVLSLQTGCQFERADKQRSMVEVAWPETSRESKPWTRWWWMGSAVDNESLTKNIENYHQSGLGGVEITPIYGVRGMEDRFIDYLSPRWMEALTHTTEEAARLDMGVDMATGTGWPFGGPHIQTKYAAGKLMVETFPLKTGERLKNRIESKNERFGKEAELIALMAYSDTGKIIDLTGQVVAEKMLNWIAPDGDWILYAMFSGQTGQRVKRAAPGGEGLVMDHMSAAALSHYLSRFDTAFASHENAQVRAFFNDSYEVYGADWSDTFLADFEKRRGYDLRTYFRELTTVEDDDASVRIKADYRETYSDLLLENFTNKWTNWAHIKGAVSRNQAHGSPGNLLDLYGAVDIPETEIFGPSHFNIPDLKTDTAFNNTRNDPLMLRFASSAAHVMGKKLTSSETGTWLGEHFSVALHQIKPEIDQLFTQGINHIFYHGTAYTPQDAPWPGWLFYASTNFGPSNAFWEDFESLNEYVTRCQSVLQSGNPGNDILLYWPVYDVWHNSGDMLQMLTVHNIHDWLQKSDFYHTAALLDKSGHTFDYVSDRQLMLAENSQGGIDLPGGKYKTIVIPKTEFMPLATLNKLRELAANGATIVFLQGLPKNVPGWHNFTQRQEQLKGFIDDIYAHQKSDDQATIALGEGRFIIGKDILKLMDKAGVPRERFTDFGLRFIRRVHAEGHHYFLFNPGGEMMSARIPLETPARSVVIMDPLSGEVGRADLGINEEGRTTVFLQLRPGESLILRSFSEKKGNLPAWEYTYDAEGTLTIDAPWTVKFISGGPTLPAGFDSVTPNLWTGRGDTLADNFSGKARYSTVFTLDDLQEGKWILDPGILHESAQVTINGQRAGSFWCLPYRLEVGHLLKLGENTLSIEVSNLSANRIAAMDRQGLAWKNFHEINFVNIKYKAFDASVWPVSPSGLQGPVRLVPNQLIVDDSPNTQTNN